MAIQTLNVFCLFAKTVFWASRFFKVKKGRKAGLPDFLWYI
jgi:hypothetical protein